MRKMHHVSSPRILASTGVIVCMCACGPAIAQDQFLMTDRTNDAIYRLRDLNHDGVITNTARGEVFLFFNASNAAGTVGPNNATAQAVSKCRVVAFGDQGLGSVFVLRDLNGDGDALDEGESIVFANATNASGVSLAFPTGMAFDSQCRLHVVNAGNASGNDGIYRLMDNNADGDAQDADEITVYVGEPFFGPGNGPFSPQEIFFDADDVLWLRNSSANLHGVYRFKDNNLNGRADDPGEFSTFFDASNASGITVSAGFTVEPDRVRPGSLYMTQIATGAVDQILRLTDLNLDGDANDAGEAVLVYSNAASGFTSVDAISLTNGDVLFTDNSGITVARLRDLNADGDFLDEVEVTLMLAGPGVIVQARQIDTYPRLGDVVLDGSVNVSDLLAIIGAWGASGGCTGIDINCDGQVNVTDLLIVIGNWG